MYESQAGNSQTWERQKKSRKCVEKENLNKKRKED